MQRRCVICNRFIPRRNMHNNLRITRILKSLGELGFEHYQAPLVHFFLEETLVKKTLGSIKRSVLDYFLFAVLDKQKRQELVRFAYLHFEPKDKFVWCPRKVQKQLRKAEKRADPLGNGDGKDEACPRSKSRDGEAAAQQKEDAPDSVPTAEKGTDKTASGGGNEASLASPDADPEAETDVNSDVSENGNDSAADVDEMDQSSGPDSAAAKSEDAAAADPKAAAHEHDSRMQTDADIDTEKPPKKKREEEEEEPRSNGSAGDAASSSSSAGGQAAEEEPAAGQTSPSAQTPLKTSKHSPSLSSGREEKIPRTDYNQAPDKKEEEETSGAERTNGKEHEDAEMESNPSSQDQHVAAS